MIGRLLGILGCATLVLWAFGCSDGIIAVAPGGDDDDVSDDDVSDDDVSDDDVSDDDVSDDDDSEYDDATLVVHSPVPGSFVPMDDPMILDAEIHDVDGEVMDFDDIAWSTDQDEDFEYVGAYGEVEDFPVGNHVVTAEAELPNGDRLSYAVGGVLVQHEYAGVYSGTVNISIDLEIGGYPISAQCVGSVDFQVDSYGEAMEGEGACVASIAGFGDIDVSLLVDGEIDGVIVSGSISIDFYGWFELPTDFEGEFTASDEMIGSFSDEIYGTTVTGEIDAHRVALTP